MKLPSRLRTPSDQRTTSRKRSLPTRRFRPQVEQLEDRLLLAVVNWIGGSGNDWNTGGNWSNGTGPGAADDAVIDLPAATVTHSTGSHTVQSLTINNPVTLSGGTLTVTGNLVQQNANTFTMTGGTLRSATVVGGGGAVLAVSGGTLDAVTLGATIGGVPTAATVQGNTPGFFVTGGLTFVNGSLMDLSNQVLLNGDQTLGGAGEIRFRAGTALAASTGQTTFGAGLTIHRSDAALSNISIGLGASIVNRGTIRADAGGTIRVLGNLGSVDFTNAAGGVLAADGGTLTLDTNWSNAGQIVVNNSTLNLGGSFTTAGIGNINRTGGTINLSGLLDNTGSTLVLDATTGSWNLGPTANGRLRGGALVTSGGAVLMGDGGTLDGVTLGATVGGVPASATVQSSNTVWVTGGLTFVNGSLLDLGHAMFMLSNQTLGGAGTIRFRGSGGIGNSFQTTFGPGLTIHRSDTGRSDINIVGGSLTNQATIRADAGGEIQVTGNPASPLTNAVGGVLSADGGTLSLLTSWSNAGQIVVNNSTLNLGGSFTTAGIGSITRTGGTINLVGLLDNTGSTLVLDAASGSWSLNSGAAELRGGNVVTLGGAALVFTNTNTSGTLNGVTLGGTLGGVPTAATVLGNSTSQFLVTGGLTFANGSLVDTGTTMTLVGDQTVGGAGEIRFRGPFTGISNNNQTTFGPGLTIHSDASSAGIFMVGGSITNHGTIRADAGLLKVEGNAGTAFTNAVGGVLTAAGGTFIIDNVTNQGTINVTAGTLTLRGTWSNTRALQVTGGTLTLSGAWSNTGALQVTAGTLTLDGAWSNSGPFQITDTTLSLGGTWSNSGAFQVTGGTLNLGGTWSNSGPFQLSGTTANLGGSFTTADLGAFTNVAPGVANLTGILDNTGSTLTLDAATGSLFMKGGTIVGGRVRTTGGAELGAALESGTLNGVTLAGTLTGLTVRVDGGLTLEQGLIDVAFLDFRGTQTLGGAGAVVFSTDSNNILFVRGTATLTVGPGVTIRGVSGFIGSASGGRLLNQGTIAADGGGTLRVQGISNFASGTLTGGAWHVSGNSSLLLIGANINTNAADILVDGASARLFSDVNSSINALAGFATNTAAGRFRLLNGANFTSAGNVNNQGSLTVGAGSTFTAATVTVAGGGTLNGAGTLAANVVNHGVVNPGASPGTFLITGSYTQGAAGVLNLELGGTTPGSGHDQLRISGSASLDGTVNLSLINGFGPATGQIFELMTFAGHTGTFSTVNGLSQGRFPLFNLAVNPTNVELNALANGTDLAFDAFQGGTIPLTAMPGQSVSVTYTVKNLSDPPAIGNWFDSVYLSRDGVLDPSDALLTRVEHVGGVAGLGSYTATATAPLPALIDAVYRVLVIADSRGLVSDANRGNNRGVSAQAISVTVPLLTLGTPVNGTIAPGQDLYYRVLVAPGRDVTVAADFAALPGAEVAVRYAALPDQTNRDDAAPSGQLHPRLLLSNTQGGTYYIRLRGREDAAGPVAYTLTAAASGFEITTVSPLKGTNQTTTPAILTLQGARFTPQTLVQLRQAGGPTRAAQTVEFISANQLVARIDLVGLPTGTYEVVAQDAGQTAVALDAFTVTDDKKDGSVVWISAIAVVRVGASIKLVLGYNNLGDNPFSAPLVQVRATDVEPNETTTSLTLGGFGILDPFKRFATHPKNPGTSTFDLIVIEPSKTPMDWDSQKAALRPATIPADAWDAVWDNVRPQLGDTFADYLLFLSITKLKLHEASGEVIQDLDRLFSFELQRANNTLAVPVPAASVDVAFPAPGLPLVFGRSLGESLTGRYRQGRLGRGWTDNFDISISEDPMTGTATLKQGETFRFFGLLPDGSYESVPGDFGMLSKVGGAFQVREQGGERIGFRADGLLDFLQDANGNRLTAGYTGTQLTSLTHTNGAALTLAYNGQGRIRQVTDPAGGVATYEYDVSGQHLIRVTTTAGTTEYAYAAEVTGPRAHTLTSITFLDGTHRFFDYDSEGRLARQQGDGGVGTLRFAYDTASFSVTDARGQVTSYFHDDSFRIRKLRDPLGRLSYVAYDASNNPVTVGTAGGGEANLGYDAQGNPTFVRNPMGEAQAFTYEPGHSRLVSSEDALGHDTQFVRDANGNLLTTTHADGSTEQYSYDAQGNVVGTVNRLGESIQYTYNSRGQVTRKDLPNGTRVDYTYNARGQPETVVDVSGTTRLEYLDPQNPDLITKITYPNGRFLAYTYQNGQRTRMVDQSGFAITYLYDAAGRLDVLSDGGGVIVDYDYDADGRLARETRGNFTVTLYAYDNAGQLVEITHRAPDATIQSQFLYAYDHLGRRTSVTTLDGVTTYEYDGAGRLTAVTLPNGRVLTYAYDAAGNRTVVGDNGATTAYTVNELNQYLAFGSTTQTFDAAGDLRASSSPGGSTSYRYDAEGRLVSQTTPAGMWLYEYDVFGNRTASTHDGIRTEYLVDPTGLGTVVGEYDGTGQLLAHYTRGLGLASRVDASSNAAYYQFDAVGNTSGLTGAGGTVLNTYWYLPSGESLGAQQTIANPFTYGGRFGVAQEGGGLYSMRRRDYDPAQGRFLQPDPIGLAGGTNLYTYADNNPVTFGDPTGLSSTNFGGSFCFVGCVAAGYVVNLETGKVFPYVGFGAGIGGGFSITQSPTDASDNSLSTSFQAGAGLATGGFDVDTDGKITPSTGTGGAKFGVSATLNYTFASPVTLPTGILTQTVAVQRARVSFDPNDIVGPAGFGAEGFVVPQATLPYVINFQNLPAATGPAAEVVVTHVLDADLDLDTFQLDDFGFGDLTVAVPAGRQSYSTRLDLRTTLGLFVDVAAGLDRVTRTVTWRLQAIDPLTLDLPISPFVGFLPPDKVAPEGQGFVSFSVRAKPGLPTGTRIDAQARIVFDTNAPIDTIVWTNTLDAGPPTSSVNALPATIAAQTFSVSWSGADDAGGSGIANYDLFVSTDGGPFTAVLLATTGTSTAFTGIFGHSYAFYVVAIDNVGHREATPTIAQAVTLLLNQLPVAVADDYRVARNGTLTIVAAAGVLANDTDPDTQPLHAILVGTGPANGTLVLNDDGSFTYTPQANFAGTDSFQYLANDGFADSNVVTVTLTVVPPATVQSVVINDGSAQRSMVTRITVTFSTLVDLDPGAFRVVQLGAGGGDVTLSLTVTENAGLTQVVIAFVSGPGGIVGGSLADGNYQLIIDATKVRERLLGQALDGDGDGMPGGDRVDAFFRLYGDGDGNRSVDNADLALFRSAFRSRLGQANYRWWFDFDNDGDVDALDSFEMSRRRNKSLAP